MNIRPLHDRVIIKRLEEEKTSPEVDGDEYLVMKEDDIMGVIE
jgi:co-chaperonin GroES (HSP10)